jgi:3-oxoadipate enol-lactonase
LSFTNVPYANHNGVKIYWEEHGDGDPLLLVMGLSFTLEMWFRVVPHLVDRYRVILFDNRGVGRSDAPPGPYSIGVMAEDAMAVLRAADVQQPAVLVGASMGGMIAQEMALRYPEQFRALVLGCTACGPFYRASWPNFRRSPGFWRWMRLKGEERERALVQILYSDTTPMERIVEDIRIRLPWQPTLRSVFNQLTGILRWSSYRRLPNLKLPTLVVHGDQDHILPPRNGRTIASRIPHAEFVLLPNTGHMITTDQPEHAIEILERFLAEVKQEEVPVPENTPVLGQRS